MYTMEETFLQLQLQHTNDNCEADTLLLINLMEKVQTIKELLHKIKQTSGWPRMESIRTIQSMILDEPDMPDDDIQQIFSDLAYDLNFYEDDARDRDEELGYYGDEKLIEVVTTAIKTIEEYEAKK